MKPYQIQEQAAHFITCTVVDWIDVFTRKDYCEIVIESLAFCQREKGLIVHAFVIMPNHIHLITNSKEGINQSDVLRDFKQFTSRHIVKAIQSIPESRREWMLERFSLAASTTKGKVKYYQFWQEAYHAEVLYSPDFIAQKLNYLHENPVKAGYVTEAMYYRYRSAINYAGGKGILAVELIDF
jgi:REP element-mobilizing transposase RayT